MKSFKHLLVLVFSIMLLSCEEEVPTVILPIEYPSVGAHGANFIDTVKTDYAMEKFSMIAILPEGTSLKVLVDGYNFGVETSQFMHDIGWAYIRPTENFICDNALLFNSTRIGEIDLEIDLAVLVYPPETEMEVLIFVMKV